MVDKQGQYHKCKVLLDSGSQSNFITERLAKILEVDRTNVNVPVMGFKETLTNIKQSLKANFCSSDGRFTSTLTFLIVSKITGNIPLRTIECSKLNIPSNIRLADPRFNEPSEVDALLGAEIFFHLLCIGQIKLKEHELILQKTRLGWVLAGKLNKIVHDSRASSCHVVIDALHSEVTKFWKTEDVPYQKHYSAQEIECERHFVENTHREESRRYTVRLPFNHRKYELGESCEVAGKRLYALERRLSNNPELYKEYVNFLAEYVALGHMEEITSIKPGPNYFIPHHAVVKKSSNTTKVRVVFDASCKTTNGVSLNDTLKIGPTIQGDLFTILTRFRTHNYVLSADIEKMYR